MFPDQFELVRDFHAMSGTWTFHGPILRAIKDVQLEHVENSAFEFTTPLEGQHARDGWLLRQILELPGLEATFTTGTDAQGRGILTNLRVERARRPKSSCGADVFVVIVLVFLAFAFGLTF